MYLCYFTRHGRVVLKRDLEVDLLSDAVCVSHQLLEELAASQDLDGLEIWEDMRLVYGAAGQVKQRRMD
jgi:hypothetical protein